MPEKKERKLITRSISGFAPQTLNEAGRKVRSICTTEQPAMVMDWARFEPIEEVLLMSGAEFANGGKVPLLDSHSSNSVSKILGSVSDFKPFSVDGVKAFDGELEFSTVPEAEKAFTLIKEKHLESVSIGYQPTVVRWIKPGESEVIEGRTFEGGVNGLQVTKRFIVHEVSVCAIPADSLAKIRSADTEAVINNEKETETTSNAQAHETFYEAQIQTETPAIPADETTSNNTEERKDNVMTTENPVNETLNERNRVKQIREACKIANLETLTDTLIDNGSTVEQAREAIFAEMARNSKPVATTGTVTLIADEKDKVRSAMVDGLAMRFGAKLATPAAGANEFRGMDFMSFIRTVCKTEGISTTGKTNEKLIRAALLTTTLPTVLGDATNVSATNAYKEAPASGLLWTKQKDVDDFRTVNRPSISDLTVATVAMGAALVDALPSEANESYAISKVGRNVPISYEAMINGEAFGLIEDISTRLVVASKDALNTAIYSVLSTNAAMVSDSKALFHIDHANIGTGAALSVSSFAADTALMKGQTAPNGMKLNIVPRFLIVGTANELNGLTLASRDIFYAGATATSNPYAGTVRAIVDANVAGTKWYLAADPKQIETIEVAYLQGKREPDVEVEVATGNNIGLNVKTLFSFGVKALNWRGLTSNAGV